MVSRPSFVFVSVHVALLTESASVLLFEPRRLAELDNLVDPMALELMEAIPHLLTVIRDIADRSEFVKQLVCVVENATRTVELTPDSTSKPYIGSSAVAVPVF